MYMYILCSYIGMDDGQSAYEKQREETIAQNNAHLLSLGLVTLATPQPPHLKRSSKKRTGSKVEERRSSKRIRQVVHATALNKYGNRDHRQDAAFLNEHGEGRETVQAESSQPFHKELKLSRRPCGHYAVIEGVRAFVEEHVPDGWMLEEREMFGFVMWMVRGKMFLGVGLRSPVLLLRVGEELVEKTLACYSVGVSRCVSASGRTFKGSLLVESEHFCGEEKMRGWFELALRHHATSQMHTVGGKATDVTALHVVSPQTTGKEGRKREQADEVSVQPAPISGDEAGTSVALEAQHVPQAASRSQQIAERVLYVIRKIPTGKVASYGQIASLAGAPQNARLVGRMLSEGLCAGGAPWHRVINSSGRISLPLAAGGNQQRQLLVAEGVEFRECGAVVPHTFWSRMDPFF